MLMTLEKSQNFTYYAGVMLDAFAILLCSKLCWHNWLKPNVHTRMHVCTAYTHACTHMCTLHTCKHVQHAVCNL